MTAKRNILIALMLLLLVAASACALAACNNTTAEIFGVQIATDDNGVPMYGGGSYVMPEGMAFSAAASTAAETDTSVTLTANYEPAGTTNQQTNWSVSFANPASSWATGKTVTDYVIVTSTGVNTAEVTCLQAFGERIIVTATSAVDSSVSDTTTVDFEKKYLDLKFTLYKNSTEVGSALNSELEAGVTFEYFDYEYVENKSAIMTYPYYCVTAKIDSTGDTEDTYRVAVTPIFSDYTVDKTFGKVYEFIGATTMYGEQYAAISGTENFTLPSDYCTAPGYWSWGYPYSSLSSLGDNFFVTFLEFTNDPNMLTMLLFENAVVQIEDRLEAGENINDIFFDDPSSVDTEEGLGLAIVVSGIINTYREAFEYGKANFSGQEFVDYVGNQMKPLAAELNNKKECIYDGETVDLGNYATAEEYFSNSVAKYCTRIRIAGTGFQIAFRFNADSL